MDGASAAAEPAAGRAAADATAMQHMWGWLRKRKLWGWLPKRKQHTWGWLRKRKPAEWIAIVVLLTATTYLFVSFLDKLVCDEELTNTGDLKGVCRHISLTPPVTAVGLIMLAVLSIFFSEVSGFGFTLKARLDEVDQKAKAAASESADAKRDARLALLAARYNEVRTDFEAGKERDRVMKPVFDEMVAVARTDDDLDVQRYLRSASGGMRLAGYAYVQAHGRVEWLPDLLNARRSETLHFNEEMDLRALRILLAGRCDRLDMTLRAELKKRMRECTENAHKKKPHEESNRALEIEKLLEQCP